MGLISATAGEARIFGDTAATVSSKEKIGYLSEIAYYYNFMEAENLLHFYGALRGISKKERAVRIKENLEVVGLAERGRAKLREYSKGMLQRFGIALALLGNPSLLILDEPTSGLDPIGQKEVKDVIVRLKARGISIFFSSHQLSEVERICDRIGIIHRGTMLDSGPLSHFLQQESGIYTIRCAFDEATAAELTALGCSKHVDPMDLQLTRLTVEEKNLARTIEVILNGKGKIVEIISGPGDLEEIFVDIIRKGDERS